MRTLRPNRFHIAALAVLLAPGLAKGDESASAPLARGKRMVFLSGQAARDAITEETHDPFLTSLSRIDCELRLSEPLEGVAPEMRLRLLKQQLAGAVTPFPREEIELLATVGRDLQTRCEEICPRFIPVEWKFVRTDGTDEGGAAYTRHDCIVLPAQKLAPAVRHPGPAARQALQRLIAHETAHVFSRAHPAIREKLYAAFGFRHVGRIDLGPWLEARRITNPDGPTIEHVLRLTTPEGKPFDGALVTYSKRDRYAPGEGRKLFDYLRFGIVAVEQGPDRYSVRGGADGAPTIYSTEQVSGFFEQVGRNTRYVIHPDEILAENLAILFAEETQAPGAPPDVDLLRRIADILRSESRVTPP